VIQYIAALRGSVSLTINVVHKNKEQLLEKLLLLQSTTECSQVSLRDKLLPCPFVVRRALVLKSYWRLDYILYISDMRRKSYISFIMEIRECRSVCSFYYHFVDKVPVFRQVFLKINCTKTMKLLRVFLISHIFN
jgi:hypothetical protein